MSLHLGILYHWSPRDRRVAILREGLKVYSEPSVHTHAFPYICLGTTPSSAWGLSGDMEWASEIEKWDLWQVSLDEGDAITIRGDFSPFIREVRVHNSLPADRLWWVAMRKQMTALEGKEGKK